MVTDSPVSVGGCRASADGDKLGPGPLSPAVNQQAKKEADPSQFCPESTARKWHLEEVMAPARLPQLEGAELTLTLQDPQSKQPEKRPPEGCPRRSLTVVVAVSPWTVPSLHTQPTHRHLTRRPSHPGASALPGPS